MKPLFCVVLLAMATHVALAQAPRYSTSPGTSLRYREVTSVTVKLTGPQGEIPIRSFHDATLLLEFSAGDSARATYEALEIAMETPGGRVAPETAPALGQPFLLHVAPNGATETVATPAFPESFEEVTDLRWQFWDFLPTLPTRSIVMGLVWTDTLRTAQEGNVKEKFARYEVVGDTVIGGVRAVVVRSDVQSQTMSRGSGPELGVEVESTISGTEHGTFYFSQERGVLLRRTRTAEQSGVLSYTGLRRPVVIPQEMRYESTLELLGE